MAETRLYGHFEPKMFGQVAFIVNYLNPEIQKVFSKENLPAPAQAAIWSSILEAIGQQLFDASINETRGRAVV